MPDAAAAGGQCQSAADLQEAHILAVGGVGGGGWGVSGNFGEFFIFSQPKTEARILFTTTLATPSKAVCAAALLGYLYQSVLSSQPPPPPHTVFKPLHLLTASRAPVHLCR